VYDDGDEEELNAKQLQEVLVQAATSGATTKKKAAALTPALLAAAAAAADALMSEDAVTAVIANGKHLSGLPYLLTFRPLDFRYHNTPGAQVDVIVLRYWGWGSANDFNGL
jgi:hypothetical protein